MEPCGRVARGAGDHRGFTEAEDTQSLGLAAASAEQCLPGKWVTHPGPAPTEQMTVLLVNVLYELSSAGS